jgi:Fe-S-cluster containining protein
MSEENPIITYRFSCTQCSHCCRYDSGYVFLSQADLSTLVHFTQMSEEQFLEQYCRVVAYNNEQRLSLIETKKFDCIFWKEELQGCSVYPARPLQCQTYPFWSGIIATQASWNAEAQNCLGMNQGAVYSADEVQRFLNQHFENPPITLRSEENF